MKTTKKKLALALVVTMTSFSAAMANQGGDQAYLNNDPIDINGYVQEQPSVSDQELETVKNELKKQENAIIINKEKKKKYNQLSRSTEKLADVTEDMIEERKESQETIDRYNKKIDCLMAEGFKEGCEEFVKAPKKDEVVVQQAAPVVEAPLEKPAQKGDNFGEMIKVLPYTGFTTMISDNETLEAGLLGGVKVETNINSRFSIGIGFNYTTMSTEDFGGNNYLDPGYVDYYQSYYGGRDIEYSNMNFDIYSKFFISKNERFRPYIGAGLGYNRNTLKYSNNGSPNPYYNPGSSSQFYGYNFGNEEVSSSSVNVELMAGSEMKFTDTIGANVEFNYMRALGGNLSSKNGINRLYAPDQQRLEDLSDELTEANVLSIFAGLLIEL